MVCACASAPISAPAVTTPTAPGTGLIHISVVIGTASLGPSRKPSYIGSGVTSVAIALDTVNGAAPPAGLATSASASVTLSSCPCTVAGPAVPPGNDAFTITTFDNAQHAISTATQTLAVIAGQSNQFSVTLAGIPHALAISDLPPGAAGTALAATAFTVTAFDWDEHPITGPYASPITLSNADSSGATTITTSQAPGELTSSTDTVTFAYSGLAIVPDVITASASGATSGTATFAPTLSPIVLSTPAVNLYATSGNGSTATFSATEAGWTGTYGKPFVATTSSACSTIASVSPTSATSFTVTAAPNATAGTCTITLSDGAGQSTYLSLTYTAASFGLQRLMSPGSAPG